MSPPKQEFPHQERERYLQEFIWKSALLPDVQSVLYILRYRTHTASPTTCLFCEGMKNVIKTDTYLDSRFHRHLLPKMPGSQWPSTNPTCRQAS